MKIAIQSIVFQEFLVPKVKNFGKNSEFQNFSSKLKGQCAMHVTLTKTNVWYMNEFQIKSAFKKYILYWA